MRQNSIFEVREELIIFNGDFSSLAKDKEACPVFQHRPGGSARATSADHCVYTANLYEH